MSSPSVALLHDYLLVRRGAERTFEAIAECWPEAPIYTLLYDEEGTEGSFCGREVQTSYLQRLGVGQRGFRRLLPAFPRAVRSLPLDRYDLVISSSSAFAHGAPVAPGARHVCYCHSPFRYAWFEQERAAGEVAPPLRPLLRRTLAAIRRADRSAAHAVTDYVANSAITRERIARHWGRWAKVVHPPVQVDRFEPGSAGDAFLVVTELVRHKRVEVALEAARLAGVRIQVVGEGPDLARLEAGYGGTPGIEFLGRVGDEELAELYSRARALVMPNVEEFGIAAVEAQAAGRPVIAAAAGGALETVVEGRTGLLVPPEDPGALAEAMGSGLLDDVDPEAVRRHARRFSRQAFQGRFRAAVEGSEPPLEELQTAAPLGSTAS